jgi:hypothetical protein
VIALDFEHMRIEGTNRDQRLGIGRRTTLAALRRRKFALTGKSKRIRFAAFAALRSRVPLVSLRAVVEAAERLAVTLTRFGPGELDDDNLAAGFKPLRDGLADALELNDRDPKLRWLYVQRRTPKTYAVRVTLEPMTKPQLVARVAELEEARP